MRAELLRALEDQRPTPMLHQPWRGRRGLDDRTIGREVSAQHHDPALWRQRVAHRPNDVVVEALRTGDVLAHAAPADGRRIEVQPLGDPLHHNGQPAGMEELLHQEASRGHEVDDRRDVAPEPVPVVEGEIDAHAAGYG